MFVLDMVIVNTHITILDNKTETLRFVGDLTTRRKECPVIGDQDWTSKLS